MVQGNYYVYYKIQFFFLIQVNYIWKNEQTMIMKYKLLYHIFHTVVLFLE